MALFYAAKPLTAQDVLAGVNSTGSTITAGDGEAEYVACFHGAWRYTRQGNYTVTGSAYLVFDEEFRKEWPKLWVSWTPYYKANADSAFVSERVVDFYQRKECTYADTGIPGVYVMEVPFDGKESDRNILTGNIVVSSSERTKEGHRKLIIEFYIIGSVPESKN